MVYVMSDELYHYGLKGMKWGVRRWQDADGTFNSAGKERYFSKGTGEDYHPVGKNSSGSVKSASGNVRRALAKNYEINERFYSKRGNETMASMNKAAKEQMLKKAAASDKAKADKLAAKEKKKEEKASQPGLAKRALAKVYDVNERYYSKHGNETMASMNRAAKEQMLKGSSNKKKTKEAKQQKGEKRASKVTKKHGSKSANSIKDVSLGKRALSKVYDINANFYSKHGNETMASMNRAAKESLYKK